MGGRALSLWQWFTVVGAVLVIGPVGCSTVGENPALQQARLSYMQAQQNPDIVNNAPVAMREAEQALQRAEQAWQEDEDREEVQHLAYLTERKVAIARATAEQNQAEAEIKRLAQERDRVLIETRAREAQTATARATQLEQQLRELQAKETERGIELTLGDVLFEVNRADLKPGAIRNLDQLAEFLRQNPTRNILIEGHTDSTGSDSYNLDLSRRRAEAVRDFLIDRGVGPARITARGYGEAYPIAPNDTAAGRQQNRRVEVVVLR
ncbi:MAG TPA: OmpA family protein [Alphaproteobacteria bacterium]|nr:OmpA family protein [Alphaproteobacteria bacterium]